MGFRFYKSVSLGKGVRLGVSKSGVGVSVGTRGARYSVHSSGRTRKTVGLPGTGLSYVDYGSTRAPRASAARRRAAPQVATPQQISTLFRAPLFAPKQEKLYVRGVRSALVDQDLVAALAAFEECVARDPSVLSAYFLAAYAALKLDRDDDAISWLERLVAAESPLPDALMTKYRLDGALMQIALPLAITPSVDAEVGMTSVGAALILAELYQERGESEKAIGVLENLVDMAPGDPVIGLSLAELYFQNGMWEELATMPVTIENTDDLSAEVLRYKARAMREEGMADGALELLKEALRSKKRHPEILKAVRYERALTYETLGKASQARRDLERLYAEDPSYADVAKRLGARDPS